VTIVVVVVVGIGFLSISKSIADQSAICAVLEKHVPNRDPQIVNGECTMLVGVGDVRVRMNVVEYGELILEDEEE